MSTRPCRDLLRSDLGARMIQRALKSFKEPRRCLHTVSSHNLEFEAWLAANRLPGYSDTPDGAGAGGMGGASAGGTGTSFGAGLKKHEHAAERRFHWSDTPAAAAEFISAAGRLEWRLDAPGVLVASGPDGPIRQPAAVLTLPRLLAGIAPELCTSQEQRDASPLAPNPAAEQQRLRQALALLAALNGRSESSSSGTTSCSTQHLADDKQPAVQIGSQLLVLLSADSAALGLYREGLLVRHKVLTGYTVRKKQGKAQMTYERQGGGAHSVGGSIRARETRRLFQGAAAVLAQWQQDVDECNQLFRSGTVRVWNELYASTDPPVPVDRRDPRWQSVGIGVRRPRLADVERAFAALSYGTLVVAGGQDGIEASDGG